MEGGGIDAAGVSGVTREGHVKCRSVNSIGHPGIPWGRSISALREETGGVTLL